MGNMLKLNIKEDFTLFRVIRCFFLIIRWLLFPPMLDTLNNVDSEQSHFRFWSLIDRILRSRTGELLRPLWRYFPKILVYRFIVIPFFLLFMLKRVLIDLKSERAKAFAKSTGISFIHQVCWMLEVILENPGIQPGQFFLYKLYFPQNISFAKGHFDRENIIFLSNLAALERKQNSTKSYPVSNNTSNKLKFCDFLKRNKFSASKIIASFSGGKIERAEQSIHLPKQDLFIKPANLDRSIGASVVTFNPKSNLYKIQKPTKPFPKSLCFDGYPEASLTDKQLLLELTNLGKTLPLLLQPRFNSHSNLVCLCGENESLVTARVSTARKLHGRSNFIFAYLRLSSKPGGAASFSSGGIAAVIDPHSGLITRAILNDEEITTHPFTQAKLAGFSVPFAREAICDCLKVHDALAQEDDCSLPIVGFDIAFTNTGYFFLEVNYPPSKAFQRLKSPLLFDNDFIPCFQSHLNSVKKCSIIHPDPIIRWENASIQ